MLRCLRGLVETLGFLTLFFISLALYSAKCWVNPEKHHQ